MKNCGTCKHQWTASLDEPCVKCMGWSTLDQPGSSYPRWESKDVASEKTVTRNQAPKEVPIMSVSTPQPPEHNSLAQLDQLVGNPQIGEVFQAQEASQLEIRFTDGRKLIIAQSALQGADGDLYPAIKITLVEHSNHVLSTITRWCN